jgi:hypothetical protein
MPRIVIVGGPRAGKTTFATKLGAELGAPVRHTDDLIGICGWSDASARVAAWFDEPGPWVVEGVAALRALRKWVAAHATGSPADVVYVANQPRVPLTPHQRAMAKACVTVWRELLPELLRRVPEIRILA